MFVVTQFPYLIALIILSHNLIQDLKLILGNMSEMIIRRKHFLAQFSPHCSFSNTNI